MPSREILLEGRNNVLTLLGYKGLQSEITSTALGRNYLCHDISEGETGYRGGE